MLYKAQLCTRLVLSSCTHPHLPECELASLSIQSTPFNSPELSLGPPSAFPLPTSQAGPVPEPSQKPFLQNPCAGLFGIVGEGHPGCVLSFSSILWDGSIGKETEPQHHQHPWESPYSSWGYSSPGIII